MQTFSIQSEIKALTKRANEILKNEYLNYDNQIELDDLSDLIVTLKRKLIIKIERQHKNDYSSYSIIYFVKSATKHDAIKALSDAMYRTDAKIIYSDYDCTGQHFCRAISLDDIFWNKSRKCYEIKQRWNIDI